MWVAATLATLACLLPFVDRAFHVDDPFYVWVGQQIQRDPLDFFGLSFVWEGTERAVAAVNRNPPGVSFFMAASAALLGWSEIGLHLAFLLPALGVVLGTLALARRMGGDPLLAALVLLTLPVFSVSATTLMSDVPMLALFCGCVCLWMRGVEERSRAWLLAGALLAGLAALTKYFAIALVPLLLAWTLARERRVTPRVAALLLPLVLVAGYEVYTWQRYGAAHLLRAVGFAVGTRPGDTDVLERLLVAFVFAGGAVAPILLYAPLAFGRRALLASAGLAGAALAWVLVRGELDGLPLRGSEGLDLNGLVHVVVFAAAGATALVLPFAGRARRGEPETLLLALWALGSFAFAAAVNYTTNGRALLPMAPALAILLARQPRLLRRRPALRYAPLLPAAALSLAVAWGDASQADAARVAARRIASAWGAVLGTLWFEGNWGFQFYLQQLGGRPVDARRSVLRAGDVLVSPVDRQQRLRVPDAAATQIDRVEVPTAPFTTMAADTAAGFYAIQWGPLPYRLRRGHTERFEVKQLEHTVLFESDPEIIERRSNELERADAWLAALRSLDSPSTCPEAFPAAAAQACGWCATPAECRSCLAERAAPLRATPDCVAGLDVPLGRAVAQPRARPGR